MSSAFDQPVRRILTLVFVVLIGLEMAVFGTCCAQERQVQRSEISISGVQDVSPADIQEIRSKLESLEPTVRDQAETILARTGENLASRETARTELKASQKAIANVNALVDDLRRAEPRQQAIQDLASLELDDLQAMLTQQSTLVQESQALANEAAEAISGRIALRQNVRERILTSESSVQGLRQELNSTNPEQATGVLAEANRLEKTSRIQFLDTELQLLRSRLELLDIEDRVELPRLRDEFFKLQLSSRQANLASIQAMLDQKRQAAARMLEQESRTSQLGNNPVLAKSQAMNDELAEKNLNVAETIAELTVQLELQKKLFDSVSTEYREAVRVTRQLRRSSSDSIGKMLRNQKDQLPREFLVQAAADKYASRLDAVQIELYYLQKLQRESGRDQIIQEIRETDRAAAADPASLSDEIEELVSNRGKIISSSLKNHQDHFDQLVKLADQESRLAELTGAFRDFINERILWIRSNEPMWSAIQIDDSDRDVFQPENWMAILPALVRHWNDSSLITLLAAALFLALMIFKPRLRKRVDQLGAIVARGSCRTFGPTFNAFGLSSLVAIAFPGLLIVLGWRISACSTTSVENVNFLRAFGMAVLYSGSFLMPVELLRRFCRPSGLAHKHFGWTDEATTAMRKNLGWFNVVGTPLVFAVSMFYLVEIRHQNDLPERLFFLLGMATLATFLHRCLGPEHGMFRSMLRHTGNVWANQMAVAGYGVMIAVPIVLGLLAIVGYYYTALVLSFYVFMTFVFGLVIETVRALLVRWLLIRRRQAHIEVARRRRIAAVQQAQATNDQDGGELSSALGHGGSPTDAELLEDFDVQANALQSQKLLRLGTLMVWFFGLWMIWSDVLPALRALDQIAVWPPSLNAAQQKATSEESFQKTDDGADNKAGSDSKANSLSGQTVAGISSTDSSETSSASTVITIMDLLTFVLFATITVVMARNLPSLIEMTFLNQLPVDASVRYAIKAIISYLVIVLGMMLAFWSINIGWAQVQWLAAAFTFGLAFGLQEIVANFVAGIILLFERPIRIGDVVSVDDTTGVVTKIRTRATTIANWDRKEYIVPNKEFITGRVMNWTLSDRVSRIVLEIGIAYGSDVQKVRDLVLEICDQHSSIMDEPGPRVTFEKFGDSSLLLIVRTFVPDIDNRLATIDYLHTQINEVFEKEGIEISFPQQDLHVRTVDADLRNALLKSSDQTK